MIVVENAMTVIILHFEMHLSRSRVQSQLSYPEFNNKKRPTLMAIAFRGKSELTSRKSPAQTQAKYRCGCRPGEPHRHDYHRDGDETAQCRPKWQTRDSTADGDTGASRIGRNLEETRGEIDHRARGQKSQAGMWHGGSLTFNLRLLRR